MQKRLESSDVDAGTVFAHTRSMTFHSLSPVVDDDVAAANMAPREDRVMALVGKPQA